MGGGTYLGKLRRVLQLADDSGQGGQYLRDVDPLAQLAQAPRRPPRSDVALAGALALWGVAEAIPSWPGAVFAVVTSAPLVVRRRLPLPVLAVIVAALLIRAVTVDGPPATVAPFPAILVAAFSAALHLRRLWLAAGAWAVAVGGMVGAIALRFYDDRPDPGSALVMVFFVTGAWTAGRLLRRREVQLRHAEERTKERAREAVAAERLRIARELHDVVAHSLSIIAVNAGAARELSTLDPDRARDHMDAVAGTAREALIEMRHLLEALRDEEDDPLAPQPTLDRLPDLIDQVRTAGLPVRLTEHGDRRSFPAGLELTAYRIVQEALTNVRRHAGPADTEVRVTYHPAELGIEVINGSPQAGPDLAGVGAGHGLAGMRERARLYGGSLDAGHSGDGGYAVRLRLPAGTP
ncbi:sensor histidine kinase [Acrocarpospora catenulata]|uniref:sensor histidine kinase n=1 Tax=Acrocarpospora catenulata TaxID=2836182 RepID=UPI001BD98153|nr:sensor histidine kinase [Acrocarpospora catenulata]